MAKKTTSTTKRKNSILLFVGTTVTILIIAVIVWLQSQPFGNQAVQTPGEGTVQIKGTMLCLPHKNTSGPQTMECAYGLKDEQGRYYGLRDSDPGYGNIMGAPMNTQVTVTGTFEEKEDRIYPTIGTIEVTKIAK